MSIDTASLAANDASPLVVMCAGTPWNGVTGSDHHMAGGLTRYTNVLWIDPPVSIVTPSRRRQDSARYPWPRLRSVRPGLMRLTPVALPGHTRPGVNLTTGFLVRAQIRWALKRLRSRPTAIVACTLDDVLTGWEAGITKVLYGTDDYVAGAELMGLNRKALLENERRQVANADLVVAISQVLADRWAGMGARVVLIPNGVQVAAYQNIEAVSPASDVSLRGPVAGVIGQLSSRIDISMLEAVAESGCSLLLVGPHDPRWEADRFAALVRREQVAWVGQRPFAELAGYLRWMDVGLTPYADTPFNRASFPLKTLEYLAAGLPAVSTDLPSVRWLDSDLIRVAAEPVAFVAAVRSALVERTRELAAARQEFAARHSWDRRASELAQAIGISAPEPPVEVTSDPQAERH